MEKLGVAGKNIRGGTILSKNHILKIKREILDYIAFVIDNILNIVRGILWYPKLNNECKI